MASYPDIDLPPRDWMREASENAVAVMRSISGLVALPPKRLELTAAADELERALRAHARPSRLATAETKENAT